MFGTAPQIAICLIGILHLVFMIGELYLWKHPWIGSGANFLRMSDGRLGRIFAGLCSKNSSPNVRSRYRSAR